MEMLCFCNQQNNEAVVKFSKYGKNSPLQDNILSSLNASSTICRYSSSSFSSSFTFIFMNKNFEDQTKKTFYKEKKYNESDNHVNHDNKIKSCFQFQTFLTCLYYIRKFFRRKVTQGYTPRRKVTQNA